MTTIINRGHLDVLDNERMRVTVDYDADTSTHIVRWQCDPDQFNWTFTVDRSIRVGELRHALAVAAIVVEALQEGIQPAISDDSLEGFDMMWAGFARPWVNPYTVNLAF